MPTVNSAIESRVQSFVAEISNLVRAAAMEAVSGALGVDAAPARRGRGRPKGSSSKPAAMPARPARAGKRVRRSAADVDAAAQKMLAYVKANDGKRLDEIAKALGTDTASLKAPSLMLLASKAVKRSGQRRGTKYHVGGGPAPASAPPKAGKRTKKA